MNVHLSILRNKENSNLYLGADDEFNTHLLKDG